MLGKDKNTWADLTATYTAQEIYQQPNTWAKTIAQIKAEKEDLKKFLDPILNAGDIEIIFAGGGTSEYVGNAVYSYVNRYTDFHASSYASTDIVETPENYLSRNKKTLLINFARSGNSPESVGSVQMAEEICKENVYHLFITCNKDGALSHLAEKMDNAYCINLTPETHDQSFAMTSSFSNMYLASVLCFRLDALDEMEATMKSVIEQGQMFLDEGYTKVVDLINDFYYDRLIYLGANCLKGVAQESQLKTCELTAGQVTTFFDSPLGFRHGPKSVINDQALTVVYISDDPYQRQYEYDLVKEMSGQRKKNRILAVAGHDYPEIRELVDTYINFDLDAPKDNIFLGLDYILVAQVLGLYKSISMNCTPDNPCPTGEVNRVVQGVTIYPYTAK
ncbi:SIS domain-containing protein [Faecalicoccus acidiformans]|uniref:SIS domain-containing protein n=1 Tax=Faecalicoccus acidiformans TaxID=915173 RepID=A0ABS2FN59_9FIRM|nr:SIS domain-containing protein [Faecalicoccus acidiformans]MBM6830751.1 SIS domain-containing protein [Faecalicoccus acidiformans]